MILTSTMIAATAGYIVNAITTSKGAKQAKNEISLEIWNWIKPIFIKEDEKFIEDLVKDPEKMKPVLEYQIKRKTENDIDFSKQLLEYIKKTQANSEKSSVVITQTHSGTGDNVGGDKITGK